LPFSRFSGPSSWPHSQTNDCLAHLSPQSPFQTHIAVFFQRTAVHSRTSFSFRNQYFTIMHLSERHNGHRLFVFGSRYSKEMVLDGAGFTQRQGGDSRPSARYQLLLCVPCAQAVVRRQSCRPGNGTRCDFLIATIKVARARTAIYNRAFHLGCAIVAATKIAHARLA
jgi:hypothetical protein